MSNFTAWRHIWWGENWVNCTVLTGNSASLRTVLSSRLSDRELRSSLRESHSFLSIPADTTTASSQGTSVSSDSFRSWASHWYIPFQIPLLTPHFTLYFRTTLWPMWLTNSKRQPCFIHHIHTHKKANRTDKGKNWQTWWQTCAVPENIQFSFSYFFFFTH